MDFDEEFAAIISNNNVTRINYQDSSHDSFVERINSKRVRLNWVIYISLIAGPLLTYFVMTIVGAPGGYPSFASLLAFIIVFIISAMYVNHSQQLLANHKEDQEKKFLDYIVRPWIKDFYGIELSYEEVKAMYYLPHGVPTVSGYGRMKLYNSNDKMALGLLIEFKPSTLEESLSSLPDDKPII